MTFFEIYISTLATIGLIAKLYQLFGMPKDLNRK